MTDRLPLPRPGPLGLIQYAGVDMHAYADAEKAALRAELERLKTVPMKYRRMAFNAQLQAENTALRADNTRLQNEVVGPLRERVREAEAESLAFVYERNEAQEQVHALRERVREAEAESLAFVYERNEAQEQVHALAGEVQVLRAALKELVGAADDDSADRWEMALNAAREQLKC